MISEVSLVSHPSVCDTSQVRYCPNRLYLIVRIRRVIIHMTLSLQPITELVKLAENRQTSWK